MRLNLRAFVVTDCSVRHLWSLSKQQAHRVYGSKLHSTAMKTKIIYYPKVNIILYTMPLESVNLIRTFTIVTSEIQDDIKLRYLSFLMFDPAY